MHIIVLRVHFQRRLTRQSLLYLKQFNSVFYDFKVYAVKKEQHFSRNYFHLIFQLLYQTHLHIPPPLPKQNRQLPSSSQAIN